MGFTAAAAVAAVTAVASTTATIVAGNQSRAAQRHAADLQEQAQEEQNAQNAQSAADERRQQYRNQRITQARIEQSAANTGTTDSSGELGALDSIAVQLNANIGSNLGAIQRGENISIFKQGAADTLQEGTNRATFTQNIGSIFSTAGQIAKGYSAGTTKIPTTTGYDTSFDNPNDYG